MIVTEVVEVRDLTEEDVGCFPGDTEDDRPYTVREQNQWIECQNDWSHDCGYEVSWSEEASYRITREEDRPMDRFCDYCENHAVNNVRVSVDEDTIEIRSLCTSCNEAYEAGCQHGHFRAVRNLRRKEYRSAAEAIVYMLYEEDD